MSKIFPTGELSALSVSIRKNTQNQPVRDFRSSIKMGIGLAVSIARAKGSPRSSINAVGVATADGQQSGRNGLMQAVGLDENYGETTADLLDFAAEFMPNGTGLNYRGDTQMKVGFFTLLVTFLLALPLAATAGPPCADTGDDDLDGVLNCDDNCDLEPNPSQCDDDGDGCGNACDGDFDQNNVVDGFDINVFIPDIFSGLPGPEGTDMDCNLVVDGFDINLLIPQIFAGAPGPC